MKTVSIIVTNYNYARFLRPCLDSALAQSHPDVEVIVVDDGSTDDSAAVIGSYASAVTGIFQANAGQASAFNHGFRRSSGDVIIFLDADDMVEPDAATTAAALLSDPETVKAHWPLIEIDGAGKETGNLVPGPGHRLPYGDVRTTVRRRGPATMRFPPTTGNAWSRSFLDQVLPMDDQTFRIGADTLLFELAPFVGSMARHLEPLGRYRIHGGNRWRRLPFADQLSHEMRFYRRCVAAAEQLVESDAGCRPDVQAWHRHGWWPRLTRAIATIEANIPEGSDFVLVDDGSWGLSRLGDRYAQPFPTSSDGSWQGVPADDDEVIEALSRVGRDTRHLVLAWSARWWLDAYPSLPMRLGPPRVSTADVDIHDLAG